MAPTTRLFLLSSFLLVAACGGTPVPNPEDSGSDDTGTDSGFDSSIADTGRESAPGADSGIDSSSPGVDSGARIDSGSDTGAPDSPVCTGLTCDGGCVPDDPRNCGACGHDCTSLPNVSGQVLCGAGGTCEFDAGACAPGYAHCGSGGPDQGCETPINTATNCGACGVMCGSGTPHCSGSGNAYSCSSNCPANAPTLCGTSCVDTTSDPGNCKTCGNACPAGAHETATCVNSACSFTCTGTYSACNGGCADFSNDNSNCGSCGNPCGPGTTCSGGHCVCNTSSGCNGCCSGGTTCEAFGNQSSSSCGAGGASCGGCSISGQTCASVSNGGACQCPAGDTACGSACVNTQTDSNNCGGCNKSCSSMVGSTCVGGQCTCSSGTQNCSGTCANTQTDGNNCGACGHSCLGGTCSAGVCQPTVFATPGSYAGEACTAIDGLTTDGTNVYWSAFCSIHNVNAMFSAPVTGGGGMVGNEIYLSKGIGNLQFTNNALYWNYYQSPAGHVTSYTQTCTPSDCANTLQDFPSGVATAKYQYGGFATNGTRLYWWATATQIDWCTISSCTTPSTYTTGASNTAPNPGTMAANATTMFWLDTTAGGVLSCQTNINSCVSPFTVVSGRSGLGVLAVDSSNVYWSDSAGVLECSVLGCGGSPTLLGAGPAGSIITDGTYVYWNTGSSVMRATIGQMNSGKPIAQDQTGAFDLGVGPSAVYWALSNGDIAMVAK